MPGRDRTGPLGQGPMTGWGRGMCGGRGAYGAGFFGGRGWRGRRMGCGWGMRMPMGGVWAEPISEAEERAMMEQELAMTEARADELRARLGREGDQ